MGTILWLHEKTLTAIFTLHSGRYVDCSTHHQQCFPTTFLSFPQLHLCGCVLAWWLFLEGGSCRMISSYALWCTVGGSLRFSVVRLLYITHAICLIVYQGCMVYYTTPHFLRAFLAILWCYKLWKLLAIIILFRLIIKMISYPRKDG